MKLRHKFLAVMIGIAAVGTTIVGWGAVRMLRGAIIADFTEWTLSQTALLDQWLDDAGDGMDPQDAATRAARRVGARVTLIEAEGTVVGDSAQDRLGVASMDNHLGRPEIQAARLRGTGVSLRISATTNVEYFYSARRREAGQGAKYVRIAVPMSRFEEVHGRSSWPVIVAVFGAMALLTAAGYLGARRLSKPLERITDVVERAAAGDMSAEIPHRYGDDEVAALTSAVTHMKEAMLEKIREVDAERSVLASIVSGMKEGLLLLDPDRRIRLANRAIREVFDLRLDPTGRPLIEVLRHPVVLRDVETALTQRKPVEESVIRIPGSGRAFELRVTPLSFGEEGAFHGALVLLFDVTRLEVLEGVRRDFVANVSHELRTPLTSIKAFVETLLEGGLEDEKNSRKFLEIVQRHADRMGALIEDLTDLSLIETGSVTLDVQEIDAAEVVRETVEPLQPLARDGNLEIRLDLPSPFPVRADRRRLEEMLTNLVDNAIKFNRPGGHVRIAGHEDEDRTVLVVEDSGEGIPSESLERIFHRFYRVDPNRSRELGGTGLGLSIVKHLMRLHGGWVRAESELGQGSRFVLEFPRVPAAAPRG